MNIDNIDKYGYRGAYSCKINSFMSLASYILVHAFERFDTYYYRYSNTTQVAGLTSYVIIPDSQ